MERQRQSEIYSADRMRRLVIFKRLDGYFQISQERVLSYESGDEYNPAVEPFPEDAVLPEWSMIDELSLGSGLFGTVVDAELEGRRLVDLG